MKEVIFQSVASGSPDSPEWHAWRARGIGGSDAPVIAADAGLTTRASWMPTLHQLWEMKVGLRARPKFNPAMQRGRDHEGPARQKFEEVTGIVVSPLFGEMDAYPEVRVSFDGVSFNRLVNLEIKVPGRDTHEAAKTGNVPQYYEAQLAHQGTVLWGKPEDWPLNFEVYFATYSVEEKNVAVVRYGYNLSKDDSDRMDRLKDLAAKLLPLVLKFWKHVELKTPPGQMMDDWALAAHEYRKFDEIEAAAKASKDRAKDMLMSLVGTSQKRSGAGVSVSTYSQQGSVDYKKVLDTVIARDAVKAILAAAGIGSSELLEKMLDESRLTDVDLNVFRGADSSRTKISIEKDYIPPLQGPVVVELPTQVEQHQKERAYAW